MERLFNELFIKKFNIFSNSAVRESLAQPTLSKDKPNYFDLIGLIAGISNFGLNFKEKDNIRKEFYGRVEMYGEASFPEYLSSYYRNNLKRDIGGDRSFCEHAGISYVDFDKHRIDIDLALAVFYIRQMRERLDS